VKSKTTKKKDQIECYGTKVDSPSPSGLSASQLTITNRDERNGTITLSDGSTYSYNSVSDSFSATAYCGGGTTSTGRAAQVGVVAVDPSVIPYGTRMYITSGSTVYGVCVAGDTGVRGHLIDLYFNSESHCRAFGRRGITVYFLD
jgi:3D (Asp-Asp-Asp) domain-containing protein